MFQATNISDKLSYSVTHFTPFFSTADLSITAVTDLPTWRMLIQVRINIMVFVKIMDYASLFHVLIDVS
jgi:hypothetical protein